MLREHGLDIASKLVHILGIIDDRYPFLVRMRPDSGEPFEHLEAADLDAPSTRNCSESSVLQTE